MLFDPFPAAPVSSVYSHLCSAAKRPIPAGRHPGVTLENPGEIALVVKAGQAGDLGEGQIRTAQVGFALLNAQLIEIFRECASGFFLDHPAEIGFGETDVFRDFVQCDFL